LAYVADPAPDTDLTDPGDTRALVRAFVLPGILALRVDTADSTSTPRSTAVRSSTRPRRPTTKGAAQ
jgi:hypothetical protein